VNRLHSLAIIIATAICAASVIVVRAETGFAGKWQGATVSGRPVGLDLKVAGQQLTGKLTLAAQIADISEGKVTEKAFSFRATVDERTVNFTGRLVGEEIELTVEGVEVPVMLKRAISK
jgi:hypothetical protein